jgi:hypothetical protein
MRTRKKKKTRRNYRTKSRIKSILILKYVYSLVICLDLAGLYLRCKWSRRMRGKELKRIIYIQMWK